jgi:hypothetical protein
MISATSPGDFSKTTKFLEYLQRGDMYNDLDVYGRRGVDALASATPRETGETAQSWGYQISRKKNKVSISWFNTHRVDGVNIAVIIQYGHGTGTGGYVHGIEYINPAIRPIFEAILDDVWKKVTNA